MATISLCMIGQDEEHCVVRNLETCVSYVDEIIFVDGGSKDRTVELVSQMPKVTVFHRPFPFDFGDQKNYAIAQAKMEWVLFKDCDEYYEWDILENLQRLTTLGHVAFAFARKTRIDGWLANIEDHDYQVRFWKNGIGIQFVGKLHEYPVGYDSYCKCNLWIAHNKTSQMQEQDNQLYYRMGQR